MKSKICNQWELTFSDELKSEENSSLRTRSYLHYVAQHQPLVAAKCWATKWLLEELPLDYSLSYSCREYMAGAGIQTTIIQNVFNIKEHVTGEISEPCVNQLLSANWKNALTVKHQDAVDGLNEEQNYDLKFLDLPSSSILQIQNKWISGFERLFLCEPKLVVWTDTSVTYPMSLHGEKYGKCFGTVAPKNNEEYVKSYSEWLYNTYNYSIVKAGFRARNAVYFSAMKGKHEPEFGYFPIEGNENGFVLEGEEKASLDEFFND